MRHVIRIEGPCPIEILVETTRSAVSLTIEYPDEEDVGTQILSLTPAETDRLAASLQAAALLTRLKCGDETRGSS
jgi:hypothetical protein